MYFSELENYEPKSQIGRSACKLMSHGEQNKNSCTVEFRFEIQQNTYK